MESRNQSGASQGAVSPVAPASPAPQPQPASQGAPQPAAPMPPRENAEPVRHQVHHSYIWLESLRTLAIVALAVVVANFSTIAGIIADGELDGFPVGLALALVVGGTLVLLLVAVGIVVVTRVVSYRHLYFIVGPQEFTLCSGVFSKKKMHVPYQRVQSVDQRATLVQRIFGVCTVNIDTAGGAANKAVVVPYLTKQQAEWLRTELYRRKEYQMRLEARHAAEVLAQAQAEGQPLPVPAPGPGTSTVAAASSGAPQVAAALSPEGNVLDIGAAAWDEVGGLFAGASVDTGRVTYEYGLTNKELFLTGLSGHTSAGLILLGIILGVLQIMGTASDLLGKEATDSVMTGALAFAGSQAVGVFVGAVVVIVLVAVLVVWILSALGTCVSYGGFKARRRDNRIEVEHGLLKHTFQGIAVDRVQSVSINQTFIRRLMGYCEISVGKIDAAEDEGSSDSPSGNDLLNKGVVVHPFVKMDRVPEILAGLIPEFADLPQQPLPVAKVARRRAIVRQSILFGGGFWLALIACAGLAALAWLAGQLEAGLVPMNDGDEHLFGLMVTFGPTAFLVLLVLAVIFFVIDVVNALLWARESSFAYNQRFMQISNGGLSRTTISFPRQKIQFGCARSNPFQRRARTRTLLATTAAGQGGTTTSLIDVSVEDAAAWLDWLKPGGNVVK